MLLEKCKLLFGLITTCFLVAQSAAQEPSANPQLVPSAAEPAPVSVLEQNSAASNATDQDIPTIAPSSAAAPANLPPALDTVQPTLATPVVVQPPLTPNAAVVPSNSAIQAPPASISVVGPNVLTAGPEQGVRVGPPNAGIQFGGGQGYRIGTPNMGVQYGGGQILRYGTTNAGVRIGGGEGFRLGTPNVGVQYGGGQILRWGTRNAGVRIGGGEGFRIGTSRAGVRLGPGGFQIGRFRN